MITGELRSKVDKLWEEFWTGGITNPLTVIEQISFLMFSRNLDYREGINERKLRRSKDPNSIKLIFDGPDDKRRWKNLLQITDSRKQLEVVRDEVFPHFRNIGNKSGIPEVITGWLASGLNHQRWGLTYSPARGKNG